MKCLYHFPPPFSFPQQPLESSKSCWCCLENLCGQKIMPFREMGLRGNLRQSPSNFLFQAQMYCWWGKWGGKGEMGKICDSAYILLTHLWIQSNVLDKAKKQDKHHHSPQFPAQVLPVVLLTAWSKFAIEDLTTELPWDISHTVHSFP